MKEILKLYAKYNYDTNKKIINLLSNLSEEELKKERNTYFKSLHNLFNHILRASLYYQKAINKISDGKYFDSLIEAEEVINKTKDSFDEGKEILLKLGEKFENFVELVSVEDLAMSKTMKIYNGRTLDMTTGKYIVQHITHEIHHQGQMSQILDEMGIEHEFGNVFPFIPDSKNV
ncbi:MAG: DinB family protein [Clostridiales bacterium]